MKRYVAASAVTLALALTACSTSTGNAPDGRTGDPDVVTIWGWRQDAPWVDLIESYNETDPAVPVEYRGYLAEEYNTVLGTGLSGSSGPDVMMLRSYGGLQTAVAGGAIASLTEDDVPGIARYAEENLNGARSVEDGELYGVPFQVITAGVFYNQEIFDELGLEEPATWDDLMSVVQTVKDAGYVPFAAGAVDSWMLPILRDLFAASEYGGPEFVQALLDGSEDFTNPAYTAANEVLLGLREYMPQGFEGVSYADNQALFVSGQAAMYPGGIWEAAYFKGEGGMTLGLFNVPHTDGSTAEPFAMGYVDGSLGMSAQIEGAEREAALEFLRWTTTQEFGQAVADDLMAIPTVPGVEPQDPLLAEATEMYASNATPYLTYVNFDYGTPSGTSLEYDLLQKMMLGQIAPADVGVGVQEGIAQWFTPSS